MNGSVGCHLRVGTILQLDALHIVTLLMSADDTPLVPYILIILDVSIAQESLEGCQCHLRFEVEGRGGHSVVVTDTTIELARETFYNTPMTGAVAYIGPTKAACRHTTQTFCGRYQQHAFTLQFSRIGSHNASRGTAVNTDIYICFCDRFRLLSHSPQRQCRQ